MPTVLRAKPKLNLEPLDKLAWTSTGTIFFNPGSRTTHAVPSDPSAQQSCVPGVNHLDAVRALQRAGFQIARQRASTS